MNSQLLEIKDRGSFLFPFELYPTEDEVGTFFVSCHYHPEVEILYVKKGSITVFVDGQSLIISAGAILFLNSEVIHSLHSNQPNTDYDAFVFPLDFLSFPSMDYCQQHYVLPLIKKTLLFPHLLLQEDCGYNEILSPLLRLSDLHTHFPIGYQISTKAALYELIGALVSSNLLILGKEQIRPSQGKRLTMMRAILSYIQEHMCEKISLREISSCFYMTPNYFCKYFKDSFGIPFTSYLNNIRLERACSLLTDTDCSIMEVGLQSGFDNLSYFIRLFKSRNGITPFQYRKTLSHLK